MKLRVVFDECLAGPALQALRASLAEVGDGVEIASLVEMRLAGAADADWVPRLAAEGWCIVTADKRAFQPRPEATHRL